MIDNLEAITKPQNYIGTQLMSSVFFRIGDNGDNGKTLVKSRYLRFLFSANFACFFFVAFQYIFPRIVVKSGN